MSAAPPNVIAQIAAAYKRMAVEARYRPQAPSDLLGNITVPLDELDLDAEATAYAERWNREEDAGDFDIGWNREEDAGDFDIGCANYSMRPAMIYAIEAARLCCGGSDARPFALRVARLAVAELESEAGGGQHPAGGAEGEEVSPP